MGRIVVFGSLNMDLVVSVPRLPQPGSTVVGDRLQMFPGGKGANQAVAAARLGADVRLIGRVGSDGLGDRLLQELRSAGVDTSGVERDPDAPTGAAVITVEIGGQNQIAVAPGANYTVGAADVGRAAALLDKDALLVLQMEIPPQAVRQAMLEAKRHGARVLLNAAPSTGVRLDQVRGVDLLVMNEHEASEILNMNVSGAMTARRAVLNAAQQGANSAIVTLGAQGAVLCEAGRVHDVPAYRVNAVDATGAGDAFVGALAMAMSLDHELTDAARLASAAAAAAVTKQGAQSSLPTVADLKRLFGLEMR